MCLLSGVSLAKAKPLQVYPPTHVAFNEPICAPTPLPIENPIKIFAGFDRSAVINEAGQAFIFGGRDYRFCGGEGGDLEVLEGFSQES